MAFMHEDVEYLIRGMPVDGNCLFRAVADQLEYYGIHDGNDNAYTHESLRAMVVARLEADLDLRAFLAEGELDALRAGGWGGAESIAAIASIFEMQVQVIAVEAQESRVIMFGGASPQVLHLLYNGVHYDSLVPAPMAEAALLFAEHMEVDAAAEADMAPH